MLALLAAATLTTLTYNLPTTPVLMDMEVKFEGMIPLLGGNEGTAEIRATLEILGLPNDPDGNRQASSDLKDLTILFNGTELPFGVENVRGFFPKTTVSITPQGRVLKNDLPNVELPVRLPGLDPKRFPELTYLPVEFPTDPLEVGKEFTFERAFSGGPVRYRVTPRTLTDTRAEFDVTIAQTTTALEDDTLTLVTNEADAVFRVTTELTGKGTVVFDRGRGLASQVAIDTEAVSKVQPIKAGETTERRLKTTLRVKLKER